jgi:hypothetical protein
MHPFTLTPIDGSAWHTIVEEPMTTPAPVPVTGSIVVKDLAERAALTFVQAAIPILLLALHSTSWSNAKALGLSALAAGGAALLSLAKGLVAQRLTGTASLSRDVSVASAAVPPKQPDTGLTSLALVLIVVVLILALGLGFAVSKFFLLLLLLIVFAVLL